MNLDSSNLQARHRIFFLLSLLVVLLLLSACSEVLNEYYISNHTDQPVAVELTARYTDTVILKSGPLLDDIQSNTRASLVVDVDAINTENVIAFNIAANETVFMGFSTGGNQLFTHLVVKSEHQTIRMDDSDYRNYFDIHDKLIGPIIHVFHVGRE